MQLRQRSSPQRYLLDLPAGDDPLAVRFCASASRPEAASSRKAYATVASLPFLLPYMYALPRLYWLITLPFFAALVAKVLSTASSGVLYYGHAGIEPTPVRPVRLHSPAPKTFETNAQPERHPARHRFHPGKECPSCTEQLAGLSLQPACTTARRSDSSFRYPIHSRSGRQGCIALQEPPRAPSARKREILRHTSSAREVESTCRLKPGEASAPKRIALGAPIGSERVSRPADDGGERVARARSRLHSQTATTPRIFRHRRGGSQ